MVIKSIKHNSSEYPEKLKNISKSPKRLFYLGPLPLDDFSVAVVGSRKMSSYGKYATKKIVGELAELGVVIVSGLALGVDGQAHKTTVEKGGRTIAVMPCGLDRIYPATHRGLAKQILENHGTLISEYDIGTEARKENFPERNRIVSGLADAVLIVEAAERSGSLITANLALEQGKTVMAVPGNINNPLSTGTNSLIRTGAHPVASAQDVLDVCGKEDLTKKTEKIRGDNELEQAIIDALKEGPMNGDNLQKASKLSPTDYSQALTMLEIKGTIKNQGSNTWSL